MRWLVQETLNEVLESEMTEFLGAGKSERTKTRQGGYRSGYYRRDLTMKVGEIELRVPQERSGQFSTQGCSSALSAFGEGTGGGAVGDVCAWGFDAPGESASPDIACSGARWVRFSVWSGNQGSHIHISPMIRGSGTVFADGGHTSPYPRYLSTCRGSTRRWPGGVQASGDRMAPADYTHLPLDFYLLGRNSL